MKQYEGCVLVETEPGHGTHIRILLPRVERPAPVAKRPMPFGRSIRGTETVLVVEDDIAVRSLIRHFLTDSGYTVLEAGSSDEAFEICAAHRHQIQLMLMDVVMPHTDGIEATRLIRNLVPTVQIIGLSAQAHPESSHAIERAGAVGYFSKTDGMQRLIDRLLQMHVEGRESR